MFALRYLDGIAVLLVVPLALLAGTSPAGYGIGAATWLALRALGVAVDRHASAISSVSQQVAARLAYRFSRVLLLVGAVVLARKAGSGEEAVTVLVVIVSAFTIQLAWSMVDRSPRPRHPTDGLA
jgi:hypothetical protein